MDLSIFSRLLEIGLEAPTDFMIHSMQCTSAKESEISKTLNSEK
jgi:hypothetical protein